MAVAMFPPPIKYTTGIFDFDWFYLPAPVRQMSEKYSSFTVKQLQNELKKLGEKTSGTKAELVERLRQANTKRKHVEVSDSEDDDVPASKKARTTHAPQGISRKKGLTPFIR